MTLFISIWQAVIMEDITPPKKLHCSPLSSRMRDAFLMEHQKQGGRECCIANPQGEESIPLLICVIPQATNLLFRKICHKFNRCETA